MNKLLGFLLGDTVFAWAQKGLYLTIMAIFYGIIISSYLFVIGALITTYNLTSTVLSTIEAYNSSANGSHILGVFFQILSCIGVIDAFNATKIMFFSSVTFLLLRLLYLQTLSTLLMFHKFITPLLTK